MLSKAFIVKLILDFLVDEGVMQSESEMKKKARKYIKEKFGGFTEKVALKVFDSAWGLIWAEIGNLSFADISMTQRAIAISEKITVEVD